MMKISGEGRFAHGMHSAAGLVLAGFCLLAPHMMAALLVEAASMTDGSAHFPAGRPIGIGTEGL